jgi:hypothetical protein
MRVVAHEGGHRATASSETGTIVLKELGLEP